MKGGAGTAKKKKIIKTTKKRRWHFTAFGSILKISLYLTELFMLITIKFVMKLNEYFAEVNKNTQI